MSARDTMESPSEQRQALHRLARVLRERWWVVLASVIVCEVTLSTYC